jgi:hypothetical protein
MTFRLAQTIKTAACLSLAVALAIPWRAMGEVAVTPQAQSAEQQAAQKQAAQKKPVKKKPVKKKTTKKRTKKPPPPPPEEQPIPMLSVADAPRDYVSEQFVALVSSIDGFFGDERHYQEANDSVLQLDLTRVMGYGGERRFIASGRAKVHLPIAEKRLHLLIETDPDKNAGVDSTQKQTPPLKKPAAPESYAAALRIEREREERWHLSADGGLQFHGLSITPFVRTRGRVTVPLEEWRMKLAESLFWFNTIGVGQTTQLDFERPIREDLLFRSSSNASWLRDTTNFDLRQDLSVFHKLDSRSALLYQASVLGVTRPQTQVMDYVLLLVYRYRLHREWIFFELSPQLHFPKERNFQPSGVLSMRLEFLFDKSKSSVR